MENIKLPAYPLPIALHNNGTLNTTLDVDTASVGFTKLELAALMIAQGMLSGPHTYDGDALDAISTNAVNIAKSVLKAANI